MKVAPVGRTRVDKRYLLVGRSPRAPGPGAGRVALRAEVRWGKPRSRPLLAGLFDPGDIAGYLAGWAIKRSSSVTRPARCAAHSFCSLQFEWAATCRQIKLQWG